MFEILKNLYLKGVFFKHLGKLRDNITIFLKKYKGIFEKKKKKEVEGVCYNLAFLLGRCNFILILKCCYYKLLLMWLLYEYTNHMSPNVQS